MPSISVIIVVITFANITTADIIICIIITVFDLLLQVDVIEDEAAGKRTIRTTTICWGNKLSLLVSTPFYDPRLPANANDPDLDFFQAQIELNTEADWQKVPLHAQHPPAASNQLHLLEPD